MGEVRTSLSLNFQFSADSILKLFDVIFRYHANSTIFHTCAFFTDPFHDVDPLSVSVGLFDVLIDFFSKLLDSFREFFIL